MNRIAIFLAALCVLVLSACVTPPRGSAPPSSIMDAAPPGFAPSNRVGGGTVESRLAAATRFIERLETASDGSIEILSLSRGGAGGAFGAGVLVGLSQSGTRPKYEIVTGVSTGALIAPFAFLGSEWDAQLADAYTDQTTDGFLRMRGLGALFLPGIFRNEPLRQLIERFITPELQAAVAREDARGRLLLVVTTNLDSGAAIVWDMGAIARRGETSLPLFRNILLASASVPAVFPPVMITVEAAGSRFQEMHVDGGVTMPFLLLPDLASLWLEPHPALRGARAFVIVNGRVDAVADETPRNTLSIMARSFDVNQMVQTRDALAVAATFAERNAMDVRFTHVPEDFPFDGALDVDRAVMLALYQRGLALAASGMVWQSVPEYLRQRGE